MIWKGEKEHFILLFFSLYCFKEAVKVWKTEDRDFQLTYVFINVECDFSVWLCLQKLDLSYYG